MDRIGIESPRGKSVNELGFIKILIVIVKFKTTKFLKINMLREKRDQN